MLSINEHSREMENSESERNKILTQINKDNIEDEKERLIGCHVWYIQNNVKMSNTTKDYFETAPKQKEPRNKRVNRTDF